MSTQLEVLDLSSSLAEAARIMVAHKIGAVPIVERDELVGIITETDMLRAFVNDCEPEH